MKKKVSIVQLLRALSQLVFLFVLPALVGLAFGQMKTMYSMIINGTITTTEMVTRFAVLFALVPITIFLGRFFCGWICSFGALNDFVFAISQRVFKTKFRIRPRVDGVLKYLKYIILAFIIVVIWTMGSTTFDNLSPWTSLEALTDFPSSITENVIGFIILALVVVGAFFIERFFCRYLCPLGAVLSLLSRFRLFNISKPRTKCGACRICTNNCPMGIEMYKTDKITSGECINCFKCLSVCPRKNTEASICGEEINPTLASAVAITVFTGIYSVTNMVSGLIGRESVTNVAATQSITTSSVKSGAGTTSNTSNNSNNTVSAETTSSTNITTTSQTETADTYKDGTYTGTARGYKPGLTVSVTVSNGKVSDIEITSHNESKGFYEEPFEVVPQEIIDSQSTKVDAVSGATRSSVGIMNAVANALQGAKA